MGFFKKTKIELLLLLFCVSCNSSTFFIYSLSHVRDVRDVFKVVEQMITVPMLIFIATISFFIGLVVALASSSGDALKSLIESRHQFKMKKLENSHEIEMTKLEWINK